MTTAIRKKSPTAKRARKTKYFPPLPPTANVTEIAGQDFIIVSVEDYADWYEDSELARIAVERLEREHTTIPYEEMRTRVALRRKKK